MSAGRFRFLGKTPVLAALAAWWDHNWRQAEQAIASLETGVTGGAVLQAGRSGGQGIASSTAADEQVGIGISDPSYLLHLSAPADAVNRETLLYAVVEDASRDLFAMGNGTTTASRFTPFVYGQVESSSAVQTLSFMGQTNVSNDTGTTPLILIMGRRYPDADPDPLNAATYTDIATRPILEVRNRSAATTALRVEANLDVKMVGGNLTVETAGKGLKVKEGTNATMGVATLVAGTVTVNTTAVAANSRIFLSAQNTAGVALHGELTVSARVAGTSFTILSTNGGDVRQVAWLILAPA